ncbi:RSB1 [Candida oxycetoniae]|uniref:Sphingoid long-chain base transporter RSB1 n=1 Tax=Candida oxycetoniae TaxID=497107 RepID=A0AAI9SZX6_9ASCO|nr:RSB1 [Candida oxycetoniae]KAI3406298.1 RSB1 [Candida oxycetoniae]
MDFTIGQLSTWAPSTIPTKTTLTSIATTHVSELHEIVLSAISRAATETNYVNLVSLSQVFRGAMASLTVISAQEVLATATAPVVQAQATQVIFNATLNLKNLSDEENLYDYNPNLAGNIIYLVVYALILLYVLLMVIKSRYWWFNVTFVCGFALEMIGFIGRVKAHDNTNVDSFYLMQIVCLTIAPAFIMAGIYFLFGQLVVIHGRQFSVLRPMWYSYFFIATDVLSLIIQAGGGGAASVAASQHTNAKPGTNTMIAGIAMQLFSMTIFLLFWIEFLNRIYFKKTHDANEQMVDSPFRRRSLANFFRLLFNSKSIREYRHTHLEKFYNQKFAALRRKTLFDWMPLAMSCAVIVVYVRCIYRVVELAEGFGGFLYSHEAYVLVLDAAMIAICGLVYVPFHPVWVFGVENNVKLAHIKRNLDEDREENVDADIDGDTIAGALEKTSDVNDEKD